MKRKQDSTSLLLQQRHPCVNQIIPSQLSNPIRKIPSKKVCQYLTRVIIDSFFLFKHNKFSARRGKKNNFIIRLTETKNHFHQAVNNNNKRGRNLLDYKRTDGWFDGRDRGRMAIRIYLMWANGYGYVLINNVYLKRIDARPNQRPD